MGSGIYKSCWWLDCAADWPGAALCAGDFDYMTGAFFWKNKGFEQHTRDVGLASLPQVGVVPDLH